MGGSEGEHGGRRPRELEAFAAKVSMAAGRAEEEEWARDSRSDSHGGGRSIGGRSSMTAEDAQGARCGQQRRTRSRRDGFGFGRMAVYGNSRSGDAVRLEPSLHVTKKAVHRVVFLRHGESEWNRDNLFSGWADVGLTAEGEREARKAASMLMDSGILVDEIFCSYLKRSIKTAWIIAEETNQAWMPIHCDWRLNEQMYGALQGHNKRATAARFGIEKVQQWRRSYDTAPPALPGGGGYFPEGDAKYAALTQDDIPESWGGGPSTESLKDAQARSMAFWRERVERSVKEGKTVLICAHSNIIRAMLQRLDGIPKDTLKELSIPRAVPLVYDLDEDLVPIRTRSHPSFAPLSGGFLGDAEGLKAAVEMEGKQLGPIGGVEVGTASA